MTEMPVFDDTTFGKKDIFSSVVSELFREGEGGGGYGFKTVIFILYYQSLLCTLFLAICKFGFFEQEVLFGLRFLELEHNLRSGNL